MMKKDRSPLLVLGVTVGMSLKHHAGLPERMRIAGWRVVVVTSPSSESRALRSKGFEVVDLPMERNPSPARDVVALARWLVLLVRLKPKCVLIGTPKASLLGLTAAFLVRVPVRIYMLHGLRLETSRGLERTILTFMERMTARMSTHVLAVSKSLLNKAVSLGTVHRDRACVLGEGSSNGVACVGFPAGAERTNVRTGRIPSIGFVGRINTDKGFSDLLKAFDLLDSWGVRYSSIVVGRPEGEAGEKLLSLFLGRKGDHTYVGEVEDVGEQYARMSILALPSYREGLGMVVLEAAAWGVPSVVSDATGVRDSVVDGVTGWIHPVGDVERLASAMRDALTDPGERIRRGAQAHERVISEFEQKKVQLRLMDFIQKVVMS